MVIASIRPSTVDGIKQLARKIRRERSITHTDALDLASHQAGFANFVHARRSLAGANVPQVFPVYLTMHWSVFRSDRDKLPPGALPAGREVLKVNLSRPLSEIVPKHRVSHAQGLEGFRMEYADHLEHLTNEQDQARARERLLKAARALHFMDATGLQPVTTQAIRERIRAMHDAPGRDHVSEWFDPATGSYLALDEPYTAALGSKAAKRTTWQRDNGIHEVAPDWEGIYYAGMCSPLLVGHDPDFLQRIATVLAEVGPVGDPQPWPHDTGICGDDFVSPARQADAKPRRPRPGASWMDHKGATPYGGRPGEKSRWRPSKPMPLEMHRELGPLMRGLIAGFSLRSGRKLSHVRSALEDWSLMEHKDAPGDDVYDIYYGPGHPHIFMSDAERLAALTRVRAILERGYEECKPRRLLIEAVDVAIAEVTANIAKAPR